MVASTGALEQKAAAGSRLVSAKAMSFVSGAEVEVWFENADTDRPHNLVIYDPAGTRPAPLLGETITRGRTQYRFRAPAPGHYAFVDQWRPATPGEVTVVDERQVPTAFRRFPALGTIALGAAIDSHNAKPLAQVVLQYLFSLVNLGLGLLLIRLRPRELAARLLALGMVGTAAVFNQAAHSALEEIPGLAVHLHDDFHVVAGLAYVYALLVFPDGRLVPRWSRPHWFKWPLRIAYLAAITAVVYHYRGSLHGDPGGFILLFGVLIPVAGVTSQALRLRRATSAAQREQSRLLVWVLSLALAVALILIVARAAIHDSGLTKQTVNQLDEIPFLAFPVLFAAIPVALTMILVRYRLWDIDRVINQTLVYATLTGVLGLVYVAIVVLLSGLLRNVTPKSPLVVAVSTLAVAALFRPVRDRVQAFIDRRFYRARYDAAKTLEAFSDRLRDEIDLDTVTSELLAVAQATMQPARMVLWLRPQDKPVPEEREVVRLAAGPGGTMVPAPEQTMPAAPEGTAAAGADGPMAGAPVAAEPPP
jgi:hypothetical protein